MDELDAFPTPPSYTATRTRKSPNHGVHQNQNQNQNQTLAQRRRQTSFTPQPLQPRKPRPAPAVLTETNTTLRTPSVSPRPQLMAAQLPFPSLPLLEPEGGLGLLNHLEEETVANGEFYRENNEPFDFETAPIPIAIPTFVSQRGPHNRRRDNDPITTPLTGRGGLSVERGSYFPFDDDELEELNGEDGKQGLEARDSEEEDDDDDANNGEDGNSKCRHDHVIDSPLSASLLESSQKEPILPSGSASSTESFFNPPILLQRSISKMHLAAATQPTPISPASATSTNIPPSLYFPTSPLSAGRRRRCRPPSRHSPNPSYSRGLPRFHPANFTQPYTSNPTPPTTNPLPTPVIPVTTSNAPPLHQLHAYQRALIATAIHTSLQASTPNSSKPLSPRLLPLGSPIESPSNPMTPLELDIERHGGHSRHSSSGAGGYFLVGSGQRARPGGEEERELVEMLIRRERERERDMRLSVGPGMLGHSHSSGESPVHSPQPVSPAGGM
ncbi:MAG: hypothetical protein M1834_002259 [Cirrosporium novae-zelandiae]|nr:MAG: hypothetical protein M1834_002259 [Cirrosporium novae-zelandiae]